MGRNSTHHCSLFLCLTSNFSLQTPLDKGHHVPQLYLTIAMSMDSAHLCCHRELHFRWPALNASSTCKLQTLLCLSMLIPTKLKPSNSLKPLLLANSTEIGQRAKISRQRRTETDTSIRLPSFGDQAYYTRNVSYERPNSKQESCPWRHTMP